MKNEKLKGLLAKKLAGGQNAGEVSVLNKEELQYAIGGAEADCSCGMLTSCGTYCKCSVKVGFEENSSTSN